MERDFRYLRDKYGEAGAREAEPIIVYQCKYFINGIEQAQKSQIKESYKMVTEKYIVKEWYLCVPNIFTIKDHKWWSEWKTGKQESSKIEIGIARQKIISKGDKDDLRVYDQLKMKLFSMWHNQYRMHKDSEVIK